jgi:hypothetical protein
MPTRYDPRKAIDLSKPNPEGVFARFGWFGPYPSRPCDECGVEVFYATDWGLGYRCAGKSGHIFGTADEWAWERGQYRG